MTVLQPIKELKIFIAAVMLVMMSSVAVAYSVHLTRSHVGDLSELNKQKNLLDVEWEKLLLEMNLLAAYNRIEASALSKLGMQSPDSAQLRVIEIERFEK